MSSNPKVTGPKVTAPATSPANALLALAISFAVKLVRRFSEQRTAVVKLFISNPAAFPAKHPGLNNIRKTAELWGADPLAGELYVHQLYTATQFPPNFAIEGKAPLPPVNMLQVWGANVAKWLAIPATHEMLQETVAVTRYDGEVVNVAALSFGEVCKAGVAAGILLQKPARGGFRVAVAEDVAASTKARKAAGTPKRAKAVPDIEL